MGEGLKLLRADEETHTLLAEKKTDHPVYGPEILASAGASVVVSNRTLSRAETVANVINNAGGRAVPFACDVLDDAALVALVDFAVSAFGTVNVLVNNAGMGGGGRENPFQIDRAYVERIYAMNVVAPWRLCQLAVPHMNTGQAVTLEE